MSQMPGNPQYDNVIDNIVKNGTNNVSDQKFCAMIQTQATLALAYEQRTANLIAMQAMGITDLTDWLPKHADAWIERAEEIEKRLGETE